MPLRQMGGRLPGTAGPGDVTGITARRRPHRRAAAAGGAGSCL